CLKLAAAGRPSAARSSRTSCQAFSASSRLIMDGLPPRTSSGKVPPPTTSALAKLWCGLHPYLSFTCSRLLPCGFRAQSTPPAREVPSGPVLEFGPPLRGGAPPEVAGMKLGTGIAGPLAGIGRQAQRAEGLGYDFLACPEMQ